ncbi:MAG: response regulator [Candidatus Ozemobacteraceae bacterium]
MNTLHIRTKMGLTIALLAVTALIIAGTGMHQMNHLADRINHVTGVLGERMVLSGRMQSSLLAAIRAEKNAILAEDEIEAEKYALLCEQDAQLFIQARTDYEVIRDPEEKNLLANLDAGWKGFFDSQESFLKLARLKSNILAGRLADGRSREMADHFVEALIHNKETTRTTAGETSRHITELGLRMALEMQDLLLLEKRHIAAPDDTPMAMIEQEMDRRQAVIETGIAELASSSSIDRMFPVIVRDIFQGWKSVDAEIRLLSRTNSDQKALQLSNNERRRHANTCTIAVDGLVQLGQRILSQEHAAAATASVQAMNLILAISIIGILLSVILAWVISRSITHPLSECVRAAEALSRGEITSPLNIFRKDEIGVLAAAFDELLAGTRRMTKQALAVSQGDYTTTFSSRSEGDELGKALVQMTEALRGFRAETEHREWIQLGLSGLSDRLGGGRSPESLAEDVTSFLCAYLPAQVASVRLVEENGDLQLLGGFALSPADKQAPSLHPGECLAGQVVIEKHILLLDHLPPGYLRMESSLGSASPASVIAIPLLREGEAIGVMELGSVNSFSEWAKEFLELAREGISIAFFAAGSRARLAALLDETRMQAEELKHREEQLRQNNEELEQQARSLRVSEEELRMQKEELRQTNEELEQQARSLLHSEEVLRKQQATLHATNDELAEKTRSLQRRQIEIDEKNITLEKTHTELAEKAYALEMASRYKSEFLANVSHELRTPLNSLLILSKLLMENRESNLTDKQIEFARTMHTSGEDLLRLIDDILDLAKVEAGKIRIEMQPFSVAEVASEIVDFFRPFAEERNLDLKLNIFPNVPEHMYSDRQRLLQIMKNLVGNAVKFTDRGSVELRIGSIDSLRDRYSKTHELNLASLSLPFSPSVSKEVFSSSCIIPHVKPGSPLPDSLPSLQPGETGSGEEEALPGIFFAVIDTGIGIPKDQLAVVFEAFQQVDGTTSRKFGGTGLGLTISRELTSLLGGHLFVTSEPEKGSCFLLSLPLIHETSETSHLPLRNNPSSISGVGQLHSQDSLPTQQFASSSSSATAASSPLSSSSAASSLSISSSPSFLPISSSPSPSSGTPSDLAEFLPSSAMSSPEKDKPTNAAPFSPGGEIPPLESLSGPSSSTDPDTDTVSSAESPNEILLLLKDETIASQLTDLIKERGFIPVLFHNPTRGLERAIANCPAAIIYDAATAFVDGRHLRDRLKEHSFTASIPLHEVGPETTGGMPPFRSGVGYLAKPATDDSIRALLDKLLVTSPLSLTKAKRLLIVEDDEGLASNLRGLLASQGLEIDIANSGKQALELVFTETHQLMILDLGLGDMPGLELLHLVREQGGGHGFQLPVIIYTGRDLSRDEETELRRYAESIIIKGPRSSERLFDEVALFLHRLSRREELFPSSSSSSSLSSPFSQWSPSSLSTATDLSLSLSPESVNSFGSHSRISPENLSIANSDRAGLEGRTVLLADDDMRNVFALTGALEHHGIRVIPASDGREALHLLSEPTEGIDLVLMDIMMPELDGFEVIKNIRSQKRFEKLPIIALTAKTMKDDRRKCLEAGANEYLTKPVDADRLLTLMRVWLTR